ncbi:MAG: hypothetical protein IJ537_11550 [Bacteroidaceae bacterium]|nr:hypothetical protein [Bacteroidaceae bacterium]MBQ9169391.1 hypothetical protein [Bacteroidaceae bacterium]
MTNDRIWQTCYLIPNEKRNKKAKEQQDAMPKAVSKNSGDRSANNEENKYSSYGARQGKVAAFDATYDKSHNEGNQK